MGQCQSTYHYGTNSNSDNRIVSSEGASLKTSFLKLHKPEREAKWILDRTQVGEALMYQADEMMKTEGLYDDMYEANQNEDFQKNGALLTRTPSSAASGIFSDFTTATQATAPMGNVNRYEPRAMRKSDMNEMKDKANALYDGFDTGFESDEDDLVIKPIHVKSERQLIKLKQLPTAERKDTIFQLLSLVTACSQPKEDWQIRRDQLMSVLHLKMKAHLGFYYLDQFLTMFPDSFARNRHTNDMPSLVFNDSEDSASSVSGGLSSVEFESSRPSTPVYYATTNAKFMDLAFTGSLGLVPRHDQSTRKTNSPRRNGKNPNHYIVLINSVSGVPIAVCARKVDPSGAPPVVRIYATKRRVFGQRPAASTEQLGLDWGGSSFPLYAWAEIVTDTMFPNPLKFSIYMASGSDGHFSATPNFQAAFADGGEPIIKITGRTDAERQVAGCALISLEVAEERNRVSFNIDVAQGIDPSLVMCFTAVADEVIEKSMTLQCHTKSASSPHRMKTSPHRVGRR